MNKNTLETIIIMTGILVVVISILFADSIWRILGVVIGILITALHKEIAGRKSTV